MAATAPCTLRATISNPSGSLTTSSPWLIHTVCRFPTSASPYSSEDGAVISTSIFPYSCRWPRSTAPPRDCTRSCIP
uniref:GMP synthase (Glutamine-hydrolyzing), putative / glutamine amidotransferase, putative n=1 Tax=Arundo donax TaxID=35708 RepID=A0A0A9E570_ARUDO